MNSLLLYNCTRVQFWKRQPILVAVSYRKSFWIIVVAILVVVHQSITAVQSSSSSSWFFGDTTEAEKEIKKQEILKKYHLDVTNSHNGINIESNVNYGVDISFPIHHSKVSENYPWLPHNIDTTKSVPKRYKDMAINPLGNRQHFYDEFMKSCSNAFGWVSGSLICHQTESDRVDMVLTQPKSMYNYTQVGFKKIKAPVEIYNLLKDFWNTNKLRANVEEWDDGNTYTNNWESKSFLLSVDDTSLRGGGNSLKDKIWDSTRDIISEWTGQELTPCSLYGIRVYTEGAILAPHVDRLPLVSSAIISVDQDVDEAWPLEVYGHNGHAYNVTMEAGDMILYESHSVIHGRPFPLKGRYMANIFIHFEPTGHTLRYHPDTAKDIDLDQDVNKKYRNSIIKRHGGHENHPGGGIKTKKIPSYIIEGSSKAESWTSEETNNNDIDDIESNDATDGNTEKAASTNTDTLFTTGSKLVLHQLARDGHLDKLKQHLEESDNTQQLIHTKDENGFTPLHEGVLGGNVDIVKLLIEFGADVNATTYISTDNINNGNSSSITNNSAAGGASVLWIAKQEHSPDHPIIEFLESIGAADIGPEL